MRILIARVRIDHEFDRSSRRAIGSSRRSSRNVFRRLGLERITRGPERDPKGLIERIEGFDFEVVRGRFGGSREFLEPPIESF